MREFRLPPVVNLPVTDLLGDVVTRNARERPDAAMYSVRSGDTWTDVTAREFCDQVQALATGLAVAGIGVGDRVGILSRTRYEWTLVDFALWIAAAVGVPLYETSAPDQVEWILADSGAVAVFVESARHAGTVAGLRDHLPDLAHVWVFDDGDLDKLAAGGADLEELARRRDLVDPDGEATVIYTSGTTGRPKGCVLTHANLGFEVQTVVTGLDRLFDDPDGSTLLFLPLAHVFARAVQLGCAHAGLRMGHSPSIATLGDDLASFRPTFVLAVPRVFEKVFTRASQQAAAAGRGAVFDRATATAIAYSRADQAGHVGVALRAQHAMFDRLVYGRLRAALGGRAKYAVSGGAPLGERLGHFFHGIGLLVLEGYGLTETSAASTANMPDAWRIGTVGRPLPGAAVRIADDGEVLLWGPQVFGGYLNNPEATAQVLTEDGWLRSGDLGELDDDGYLRITGRKKELIVTAGGKNVAPAALEDRIRAHPLVSQVLVVGDGRPYVAALVTLDPDAVAAWAAPRGKPASLLAASGDPELVAEVQAAVDEANGAVSQAESIRRIRVLPVDWTEESGHLTPSMKLKRGAVARDFAGEVERLYA